MSQDFKIIAAKNPAQELRALNESLDNCCVITEGKNGETLFDGFDMAEWAVEKFEAIASKYASKVNPGTDDGISYMRKDAYNHCCEIVEYTNGETEACVNLVMEVDGFEKK